MTLVGETQPKCMFMYCTVRIQLKINAKIFSNYTYLLYSYRYYFCFFNCFGGDVSVLSLWIFKSFNGFKRVAGFSIGDKVFREFSKLRDSCLDGLVVDLMWIVLEPNSFKLLRTSVWALITADATVDGLYVRVLREIPDLESPDFILLEDFFLKDLFRHLVDRDFLIGLIVLVLPDFCDFDFMLLVARTKLEFFV